MKIVYKNIRPTLKESIDNEISDPRVLIRKSPSENGVFSFKIFGQMLDDTPQCPCGHTKGTPKIHSLCEKCGGVVQVSKKSLDTFGWINLDDEWIINPIQYDTLNEAIGKNIFKHYVEYSSSNTYIDQLQATALANCMPQHIGKGLKNLKLNLREIIEHHHAIASEANREVLGRLLDMDDLDDFWLNSIPVVHSRLRPAALIAGDFILDSINAAYVAIVKSSELIKNMTAIEKAEFIVQPMMSSIQARFNYIASQIIDRTSGKTGTIRESMIGKRLDFTMRAVIVPRRSKEDMDKITLPYAPTVVVLEPYIIHYLTTMRKMTVYQAYQFIRTDMLNYSHKNYEILMTVIRRINPDDKSYLPVIINRNPTIKIGGMLQMNAEVARDDELVIAMSNLIHEFLGSDYDGDVPNIFLVPNRLFYELTKKLKPSRLMKLSNKIDMRLTKDYGLGLATLNL